MAALVGGLLAEGISVRIQVTGTSMSPCIRSGDVVTITPPPTIDEVRLGDVIAFSPHPGQLLIHRVVARTAHGPLTRGDATPGCDEPAGRSMLGVVRRVQRAGRPVRLGLGPERLAIALAQRCGLLRLLRALSGRLLRARSGRWATVLRRAA